MIIDKEKGFWKNLPRSIRIIFLILSIITVVFWVGFLLYHLLNLTRAVIHFLSDKSHFWIFLLCVLICCIIALLFAQFYFKLDPIGKTWNWILKTTQDIRDLIANFISGKKA